MIFRTLILILSLFAISLAYEYKTINNTLFLCELTLPIAQKAFPNLVAYFHDPTCLPCQKALGEYYQAATKVATNINQPTLFQFGYADTTLEKDLASTYKIRHFPTILFFKNGKTVEEYDGPLESEFIYKWALSNYQIPTRDFGSFDILDLFGDKDLAVLINGKPSTEDQDRVLEGVRKYSSYVNVMINNNEGFATNNDVDEHSINIFSRKDRTFHKKLPLSALPNTIENYLKELVRGFPIYFDEFMARQIEDHKLIYLCYFMKRGQSDVKQRAEFYKATEGVPFQKCRVDISSPLGATFAHMFGINENEVPAIRIFDRRQNITEKHKFTGEIKVQNIKSFYEDFINGKTEKFYLSEAGDDDTISRNRYYISKITRGNIGKAKEKDLLVLYCAPGELNCRAFDNAFKNLAYQLRNNDDVIVGEMNVLENDINFEITEYPWLVWYTKKNPNGIAYEGAFNIRDVKRWLKEQKVKFDD